MEKASSAASWRIGIVTGLLFWVCTSCVAQSGDSKRLRLESYARIESPARNEVSGIVKSRTKDQVFWVHGDSGNDPKIYPVNKNGEIVSVIHSDGVELDDIDNIDWEDIAVDTSGNLIIADIGNNCLCRENLSFLIFPEPDVNQSVQDQYQRIRIQYPEKGKFFGWIGNDIPDAEAIFYHDGAIYLLTKEGDGDNTRLYKLEDINEAEVNTLKAVDTFNFDNQVTAADISPDGSLLTVLTSSSVWLFADYEGEAFFSGSGKRIRIRASQVESITFSGEESLIISEEDGRLYEVLLSDF